MPKSPAAGAPPPDPLREPDDAAIAFGFLGEHVGFQLHIARRALMQKMRDLQPAEGTKYPAGSISVLALVELNPGISQQDVAHALFLDPPKVTLLIKQLIRADLIRKAQSTDDRRRQQLFLTDAGAACVAHARASSDAMEAQIAQGLTGAERHRLIELLGKMQAALR